jgi:hypothetical protein
MHSFAAHLSERRPSQAIRVAVRPPVLVGLCAALILVAAAAALWLNQPAAHAAAEITLR